MSILYQTLLALALLAGSFGAGWLKSTSYHEAKAAKAQLAQEQATRVLEAQASRNVIRISDELTSQTRALSLARRDFGQRMRDTAKAYRAEHPAASCPNDAPPAAVLSGVVVANLGELAERADEVANNLRACQAYVREVIKPKE